MFNRHVHLVHLNTCYIESMLANGVHLTTSFSESLRRCYLDSLCSLDHLIRKNYAALYFASMGFKIENAPARIENAATMPMIQLSGLPDFFQV